MKVSGTVLCAALTATTLDAFSLPSKLVSSQSVMGQPSFLSSPTWSSSSRLHVSGMGWDNDDFLSSLGRSGNNQEDGDNDDFDDRTPLPTSDGDLPSRDITGAALTEEMKQKLKASHTPEEEASQGGQMFRKLLERAQQAPARRPIPSPPPFYPPPPPPPPPLPTLPPPFPTQQVGVLPQMPADFNSLPVEEQARLFREMMAAQQQQQQQQQSLVQPTLPTSLYPSAAMPPNPYAPQVGQYYPPPLSAIPAQAPPNYLGPGVAPDGRKIGRNKDADAIVNTADMYFAQLKRDSTTRNIARYSGDEEKANQIFYHPSIQELTMHINPYLQEQKEKEKALFETVPEEMLIFQSYSQEPARPKNYSGISYKEKLAQLKAKKEGNPLPSPLQPQDTASRETTPTVVPSPQPVIPPAPVAMAIDPIAVPSSPATTSVESSPPVEQQRAVSNPTATTLNDVLTGDTRQDIRTLMGLMLKHRGGPGFGAGRLQGAEAERLEALAKAIPQLLAQEEPAISLLSPPPASSPSDVSPTPVTSVTTTTSVSAVPISATTAMSSIIPQTDRVQSMIACIEGAVTMYKNSPPELQGSVLVTLRAALLAALDTLSQALKEGPVANMSQSTPSIPASLSAAQAGRMMSMVACIDGAITMYKNSPIELQESVLITLRSALLAAVGTCNEILAVRNPVSLGAPVPPPVAREQDTERTGLTSPSSPPSPSMIPQEVATPSTPEPVKSIYSGNDANTQMLQEIYERIKNAGGPGKMGLRPDLSATRAKELKESLTDMRTLLVDELHSGIPEGSNQGGGDYADDEPLAAQEDAVVSPSTNSVSTTSKYQQMLEKARAEKEAKNDFQ